MAEAAERPARSRGYDSYDPYHPMWADTFWDRYCRQPSGLSVAAPAPGPTDRPGGATSGPRRGG